MSITNTTKYEILKSKLDEILKDKEIKEKFLEYKNEMKNKKIYMNRFGTTFQNVKIHKIIDRVDSIRDYYLAYSDFIIPSIFTLKWRYGKSMAYDYWLSYFANNSINNFDKTWDCNKYFKTNWNDYETAIKDILNRTKVIKNYILPDESLELNTYVYNYTEYGVALGGNICLGGVLFTHNFKFKITKEELFELLVLSNDWDEVFDIDHLLALYIEARVKNKFIHDEIIDFLVDLELTGDKPDELLTGIINNIFPIETNLIDIN